MRTSAISDKTNRSVLTAVLVALILAALVLSPTPAQADGGTSSAQAAHASAANSTARKQKRSKRHETVRGTLASLPPIVQPGVSPATPSDEGALVATFTPASPGQEVTLEKKVRRGWKAVATSTEDAWGSAAFSPAAGTYRARTTADGRTWVTGSVTASRWQPEFEDTFSGTALDTSVWNDQKREHESVYAPRTCSRVDASARSVSDGVLHLGIALDPALAGTDCTYTNPRRSGTSPYLLNSQVSTEYTRFFQHGIVAARIKPQRARGIHSGFWLLPADTQYTDGVPAAGTEIDVMEFFGEAGRGKDTISSHVHYYEADWNKVSLGDTFPVARQILGKQHSWWDEFHVFSVEWTPTTYIFRVDGREYYRETKAISQAEQYLVLSALTSDYELGDLTPDELSQSAQVDWVRVFDATSHESARVTRGRKVAGRTHAQSSHS